MSIGVGDVDVSSVYVHYAIWCNQYICALSYMWHLFGVTVFHRCIARDILSIGVGDVDVSSVYVHAAICDTYFGVTVFHRSIVNWSVGYMYLQYMCILWYV